MIYKRKIFGYECDIYGHLNNSGYLRLYEEGRSVAIENTKYSIELLKEMDIALVIIRADIQFIKEIPLEKNIIVKTNLVSMNRVRFEWHQEIHNENGDICSSVEISGAFARSGKPIRINQEIVSDYLNKLI